MGEYKNRIKWFWLRFDGGKVDICKEWIGSDTEMYIVVIVVVLF